MKKMIAPISALLLAAVLSSGEGSNATVVLNEQFFSELSRVSALRRDEYLTRRLKGTVSGECIVKKADSLQRYDRKYRIIGTYNASGFLLHYYLFTGSETLMESVRGGKKFSFSGTFMSLTPLNMKKDSYIFDIKLAVPENEN